MTTIENWITNPEMLWNPETEKSEPTSGVFIVGEINGIPAQPIKLKGKHHDLHPGDEIETPYGTLKLGESLTGAQ